MGLNTGSRADSTTPIAISKMNSGVRTSAGNASELSPTEKITWQTPPAFAMSSTNTPSTRAI